MNNKEQNNNGEGMTLDKLGRMVANVVKNMATKDDIRNMATKDDIKNLATKDDLKKTKEELVGQISGVNNRIDELAMNRVSYENFDKLKARVDVIEEKVH